MAEKDLAVIVKGLRNREGYTIKELANVLGISTATIGGIEHGTTKVSERLAKMLCEALNTTLIKANKGE